MKKNIINLSKSTLLLVVLVALLSGIVGATAAVKIYNSNEITYDNTNSRITASDVQGAIDELYAEATTYQQLSGRVSTLEGKSVVEIESAGTSNGWTYKKYSDGTAEMWKTASVSTSHVSQVGQFYQYNILNISLPFSLANTNYVVAGTAQVGNGAGIVGTISGLATNKFNYILYSTVSGEQNVTYRIYVYGTWR